MITDSYSNMVSRNGMRSLYGGGEVNVEEDLGLMLGGGHMEGDLNIYRSGSAPPTIEGSVFASGGMSNLSSVSEEEMRSDPSYVSYYYSNGNMNPRLPPPLLSKEDWRMSQRGQGGVNRVGGIGDGRKTRSSCNGGEDGGKTENGSGGMKEWGGDGLIGLTGLGIGTQKSIAEVRSEMSEHTDLVSAFSGMNFGSPSPQFSNHGFGGSGRNFPAFYENGASTLGPNWLAAPGEFQNLSRVGNQYLRSPEALTSSNLELLELQKAYLGSLLAKPGMMNHGHLGRYPGSPVGGPLGSVDYFTLGERNMRFPSGMRNLSGGINGLWHPESNINMSSLLDEFKNNKTNNFDLAEIAGHVVEFSADQFGSRFIQQKLETASTEEKDMVFHEIMPQALTLMTDVFGNYVIQKFFEHGSASQIRQLADQLTGHVLTLSLQMYGCRVIQKAIEVVDVDQKTSMVVEIEGHVIRCVRDQNGNHVIQKCIECVPEDAIQFIVSTFYEQVVALSSHPYGCRVIQRVLEHCHSPKTQRIMMDEIMESVCMLAQDQYGNYVVQHVMQHGQPHERTLIINKLIGKIVPMSQQKFASNVVEKCLTYGTPEERKSIVDEMLGSTDENEPLQVMMKDQFANYVVQKVLETCDDQQLELILNRIKVHLTTLKKYTYGKHIVARVEKLVVAGERRIGVLNSA